MKQNNINNKKKSSFFFYYATHLNYLSATISFVRNSVPFELHTDNNNSSIANNPYKEHTQDRIFFFLLSNFNFNSKKKEFYLIL